MIIDNKERHASINPNMSFIVNAPAGSGKTTLILHRIINCLLEVQSIKHVLVLTFTRKAAQEINQRLHHLIFGKHKDEMLNNKILAVREHAQKLNWNLENKKIEICKTFDSFNQMLCLDATGISPHPPYLYEKTIDSVLSGIDYPICRDDLLIIKSYMNNDTPKLKRLLVSLLSTREQWLDSLLSKDYNPQKTYEDFLWFLIDSIDQTTPEFHDLIKLIKLSPHSCKCPNSINIDNIKLWERTLTPFLTKTGSWKSRLTVREGFSTNNKELKLEAQSLLNNLSTTMAHALSSLFAMDSTLAEKTEEMLLALRSLLPKISAILNVTMNETNQCDYTGMNLKILDSLSSETFMYQCDQIHHLLVDEFQDTSRIQVQLLTSIVNNWDFTEKRSVFIVGDPMQSIYKFRQADVRQFLLLQQKGLGCIELISLNLKTNFRSTATIVDHSNQLFKSIFPKNSNPFTGAVAHNESIPFSKEIGKIRWVQEDDYEWLNKYIHGLSGSVGIIARTRGHLNEALIHLRDHEIDQGSKALTNYTCVLQIMSLVVYLYQRDELSHYAVNNLIHLISNKDPATTLENINRQSEFKIYESPSSVILNLLNDVFTEWQFDDIGYYFLDLLDELYDADIPLSRHNIEYIINHTYFQNHESSNRIQALTIHQAKGLEFDHIIIPAIHRFGANDADQLLYCHSYKPNTPPLIGTINDPDLPIDGLNKIIRKHNYEANLLEQDRLFYVAITRAKKSITYIGLPTNDRRTFANYLKYDNKIEIFEFKEIMAYADQK